MSDKIGKLRKMVRISEELGLYDWSPDSYVARAILVDQSLPRAVRAEGSLILGSDGRWYTDLIGGVGCLAVGHAHPRVVEAISSQAGRFTHTDYVAFPYELYEKVCERLCLSVGIPDAKAALFNSGAEAVENAVKIARYYTGRPGVVGFTGAFHGRTYMALSLTDRGAPIKAEEFGPFLEVLRAVYPSSEYSLDESLWAVEGYLKGGQVACVVVEPVLGEGGVVIPPRGFLSNLRSLCDRYSALLVVDEIQTGFGRTGTMWAFEKEGIVPDIVIVGKSIAAGMPLSGVVGRADVVDIVPPGGLGGTYIGNPVACAAALVVFDIFEEEKLVEKARTIERIFAEELYRLVTVPGVKDVRGTGAMFAVEFDSSKMADDVLKRTFEKGVLALIGGVRKNVVRFLPPLVITERVLRDALEAFVRSVREVAVC